ncbi:hypothetical protein SteCoe_15815 [Stentor coeruleus]|uniref:Kinesin motor domain-containing protein n=1 Tax=Stentor coeruleus TaxID=5963 RepID=A0A1R2C2U5_9CILI|nr:hypothetical protein SteCoe_15815 [Stentor coeruleus]
MDAVTVVARFRGAETGDTDFGEWSLTDNTIKHNEKHHEFNFDAVLNPSRTQAELYEAAGRKIINFFCDGYNATIFAYGQSGSGKTFSMLGPEEVTEILINSKDNIPPEVAQLFGITPRATFHIFENIKEGQAKGTTYTLKVSYLEVYNEMINDILQMPPGQNLKLREYPNEGMKVIGIFEQESNTPEKVFEAISNGTANRIVCSTGQNARSSRSHTVFVIALDQVTADGTKKSAKINLVDLAGSEKLSKTGAEGQALKEAQKINLSLTTLGRCIKALTSGGGEHVPYRESKLTLILKESLSGAAMTTLIVTGSMRKVHQEETIGTMQFAERAKQVKTSAKSNTKKSYEELEKLYNRLTEEVKMLKSGVISSAGSESVPQGISEAKVEEQGNVDNSAFEELKGKYESLKESSIKEIETLRNKIAEAEANMNKIDYLEVHEEMEAMRDQLELDNKKLETLSKSKEEERIAHEKILESHNLKVEEILQHINHAKHEFHKNQKQIAAFENELGQKDQEIFQKNEEVQKIKHDKKEYKNQMKNLEEQVKAEEHNRAHIESEIEKVKAEIAKCKEKKEELEEGIDKAEADSQEIMAKSFLLKKKEAGLIQETERFKAEKANLEHEYEELKHARSHKSHLKSEFKEKSELEKANILGQIILIESQIEKVKEEFRENKNSSKVEEFNKIKIQYAEAKSAHIVKEIAKTKEKKHELLSQSQKLTSELEKLKELTEIKETENQKLKEEYKKATVACNRMNKEISDEKQARSRLIKNIRVVEDSLVKAIKEAEHQAKVEEQMKMTEYIQKMNIMRNEVEKKQSDLEKNKKLLREEISKVRAETQATYKIKIESDSKIKAMKIEYFHKGDKLFQTTGQLNKNLAEKNSEIMKIKQLISENESKINQANTQIAKLEADVRHKEAERDIERKNTIRSTIVPRKMSTFQAPIPKPDSKTGSTLPSVVLKKTGSKFLEAAFKESEKAQNDSLTITETYKVHYEIQSIKALYANLDYVSERKEGDLDEVPEEHKRSSSSSSSSSN